MNDRIRAKSKTTKMRLVIFVIVVAVCVVTVECQTKLVLPNIFAARNAKKNCRYGKCEGDPWKFLSVPFSDETSITVAWIKDPSTVGPMINYTVYYKEIAPIDLGITFTNSLSSFRSIQQIEAGTMVGTKVNADNALQYLEMEIKGLKKKTRYEINLVGFESNGTTKIPVSEREGCEG
eukprot:TRINITY_DN2209_c0_g2_i3.p1 TRINITY_DN2209_c0_g2~~TRINITY_DN2209_c0_g2_i3.p1  ORF type:complete len:178 (-),score=43.25 TRINITY_DN2209_c0_g2_i3:81-614(-)